MTRSSQRDHGSLTVSIHQKRGLGLGQRNDAKGVWEIVRETASRTSTEKFAPNDLLRYAASHTMPN